MEDFETSDMLEKYNDELIEDIEIIIQIIVDKN
jgi:hypothetical protein